MKRSWLSLLLILTLSLALSLPLAGCGEKTLLSPNDPVELTFWHVYGEQAGSPMDVLVDEFNRTVGKETGVSVKVTGMSSAAKIGDFLLESQAGGADVREMPDLFTCHLDNAVALGLENLVDWNDWFSEEEQAEFVPGFLADGTADGKLAVFPISKSTHVLMLNGSGFGRFSAATGVEYDDLMTWEGFYEAAGTYHDWSGGQTFCALDYPVVAVSLNAMEHGATEADLYVEETGWYNTDNEALQDSWMQFARALVQGHVTMADLYSNTQVMTGEVLCGIGSSAAILYYNDTVSYLDGRQEPMDLHVLPTPMTEGAEPLTTQAGVGLVAYKSTEAKAEAASLFVHWLTESQRNLDFVAETGYMPVRDGAFAAMNDYEFPDESYEALYAALQQAHERYTPVSEPKYAGYYDKVLVLYDWLRQNQASLAERAEAGEDVETLARETWDFFRGIA